MKKIFLVLWIIGGLATGFSVLAMGSVNYQINSDVIGSGGNPASSSNYELNDTLGQPVIGIGGSGNFNLQSGFWYMVNYSLSMTIDSNTVSLGTVTPGTPNTASSTINVATDAWGGYNLLCHENTDLTHTDATTTIGGVSGTIASPTAWSGTGLGFTVSSATNLESKWNNGNNYASFPLSASIFHSKSGYTSGNDQTVVGYKVDVNSSQKSGSYSNIITYTAVSNL